MDGWTIDDVILHCRRHNLPLPAGIEDRSTQQAEEKKPSKYRNIKTDVDGETYDSRREARRWKQLQLMHKSGEVLAVARQVNFRLPGGIIYRADFVLIYRDRYVVEDAKGVQTDVYKIKKKLMKECLGIEIVEV